MLEVETMTALISDFLGRVVAEYNVPLPVVPHGQVSVTGDEADGAVDSPPSEIGGGSQ